MADSLDSEPGTQLLIIGGSAGFEVREPLGNGFRCSGSGKDVHRLFQRREVITRDQHGGSATMARDSHPIMSPFDSRNILRQVVFGFAQWHGGHDPILSQKYGQIYPAMRLMESARERGKTRQLSAPASRSACDMA